MASLQNPKFLYFMLLTVQRRWSQSCSYSVLLSVYSTGRFMFSLALFFVLVLFSVILALWSHCLGKRELCWTLIFTLPIFHTCKLFARIQRPKNSHEFVTDFERICHTCVTYTFYTSFIGGMNANSSHCSKYPFKKLPFCYVRIFHVYFIIFLITL